MIISLVTAVAIIPMNFCFDFIFEKILNAPTLHQVELLYHHKQEKERITYERFMLSLRKEKHENLESGLTVDDLRQPHDSMSFAKFQQRFEGTQSCQLKYASKYRHIVDDLVASRLLAVTTCATEFPVSTHQFPDPWYEDEEEYANEYAEGEVAGGLPPSVENPQYNKVFAFNNDTQFVAGDSRISMKKVNFATFYEEFYKQCDELIGDIKEDFVLRWG